MFSTYTVQQGIPCLLSGYGSSRIGMTLCCFVECPLGGVHGGDSLFGLVRRSRFQGSIRILHNHAALGQHPVSVLSFPAVRVTHQLTTCTGVVNSLFHEGVVISSFDFRSLPVGFGSLLEDLPKRFIPFRDGKSSGRPGGPLSRRVKAGKAAAHVLAPNRVAPFGICKLIAAQGDRGLFPGVHLPGRTRGHAQPALIAVILLGCQGIRCNQRSGGDRGP